MLGAAAIAGVLSHAAQAACPGQGLPPQFRLDYAVTATRSILSLSGDGSVSFQRAGDRYELRSGVAALGVYEASQKSSGRIDATGLHPTEFTQKATRRDPRTVTVDRAAKLVRFSGGEAPEPLPPRLQDRLSMLLQMAFRLNEKPAATSVEMPVAGPKHVSQYRFEPRGAEAVATPSRVYDAVKYERDRGNDDDDKLEVWFAADLCYLPVRLRFTDDRGLVVDQKLTAAHFD